MTYFIAVWDSNNENCCDEIIYPLVIESRELRGHLKLESKDLIRPFLNYLLFYIIMADQRIVLLRDIHVRGVFEIIEVLM